MFRLALVIIFLICLTVPSPATAEEREQPLSIKGLDWHDTQLFMVGISHGVGNANIMLRLDGKPRLFCPPFDLSVNGGLLWELASKVLEGPHEMYTVAIAALDELKKKYPCTE